MSYGWILLLLPLGIGVLKLAHAIRLARTRGVPVVNCLVDAGGPGFLADRPVRWLAVAWVAACLASFLLLR